MLEMWGGIRQSSTHLLVLFLTPFWTEVHRITQKFTDWVLPRTPEFFLLHHHKIPSKAYRKSILPLLVTAAKSCIPWFWKRTEPPGVAAWLRKVADIHKMKDLVATDRGLREQFFKRWFYWLDFPRPSSPYFLPLQTFPSSSLPLPPTSFFFLPPSPLLSLSYSHLTEYFFLSLL